MVVCTSEQCPYTSLLFTRQRQTPDIVEAMLSGTVAPTVVEVVDVNLSRRRACMTKTSAHVRGFQHVVVARWGGFQHVVVRVRATTVGVGMA